MSRDEMLARGWDEVDIVFVTGDAYVDHPSFAMALLGRLLESEGFRVGIVSQPDWRICDAWRTFGRPRLFFAISAGNMDSMINHYTANRKVRNDDAYSPGGQIGRRPDRATLAYCQRAREAYHGVPVIAGGVEASLRRLAHYDYWSDKVRRSIILDCKADLLVYGMGERAHRRDRPAAGGRRNGARSARHARRGLSPGGQRNAARREHAHAAQLRAGLDRQVGLRRDDEDRPQRDQSLQRPAAGAISRSRGGGGQPAGLAAGAGRDGPRLRPALHAPAAPELTASSGFRPIEVVKDSVQIMRGCFGGCTFCSITAHEGRIIQSRSQESVLGEIRQMAAEPEFNGVVSDIGGPTANMYQMRCTRPEVEASCRRLSCVHPTICKLLGTDHGPLVELMQKAREEPGVKKVLVASGIRMDLARRSPEYMRELAEHHVGGHLKVAPEHTDPDVLALMKKPGDRRLRQVRPRVHNGHRTRPARSNTWCRTSSPAIRAATLDSMIDLALFLKRNHYRPDQVQDFIPSPFDIAACMYHTGLDPFTKKPVLHCQAPARPQAAAGA